MEYTAEQVKMFFIVAIIGSIIYMLIYSKKGQERNATGYFVAVSHCFTLTVVSIFIVVGFGLIKVCLTQPLYAGLIIPFGWFFIAYNIIKNFLNEDFGLNIHILNPEWKVIKLIKENTILIPISILVVGFSFATFMILFKALPDTANQPYGPLPVLLAGLVFLAVTIGLVFLLYSIIIQKVRFVPNKEVKHDEKRVYKVEKNDTNKKIDIKTYAPLAFFMGIILLVGLVFVTIGISINKNYKEKTKYYVETQGKYIDAEKYSTGNDSGSTYSLIYAYEVNGRTYTVSTDYGTSFRPKKGTQKTILYDPADPSESIIKGNASGKFVFIFGLIFCVVPVGILVGTILGHIKNEKIKNILETIKCIFIGVCFMGGAAAIYYLMCAGGDDFSIGTALQTAGFAIVFPLIFAGVGIMIIGSTIYLAIKDLMSK